MTILLRFAVLGALLFGAKQLSGDGRALGLGVEPIAISAGDVERLRAEWRAETHREPSHSELDAAIRHEADQEALLREALRLGLDRTDPVVRSRLLQNMRFSVGTDSTDFGNSVESVPADSSLLAEAFALDMPRRDVVTRRRLVQAMEEQLAAEVRVDDADVRAFVAANPGRYQPPVRITFEQVFIPDQPASVALLPGSRLTRQSEADLARTFGGAFARAAMQARPGEWAGPIRSAYGLHVIRVAAAEAAPADEAAVLRQARFALLEERERASVQAALASLRRAYPVRIEWPALAMAGAP